ncbi:MAG: hypothetical protein F9K32_03640 [Desulfobulbaceae bacterium]|nr:MAG: hypothetical protein F9K32_03640 [Desulfobulbaceae bacterium]
MNENTLGIHEVYDTREKYIIIGLTGRTGAGCSTAAEILAKERKDIQVNSPNSIIVNDNEGRKINIVKRFIEENWEPFVWIKIKDIITSFIVEVEKEEFIKYVSLFLEPTSETRQEEICTSFVSLCGEQFDILREIRLELKEKIEDIEERHAKNKDFYFNQICSFTDKIKEFFDSLSTKNYTKVYQKLGDNIRSSGSVISSDFKAQNIFSISKRVNRLLKIFTHHSRHSNEKTYVVIDTLRNPFEALYFRERYSAFYLMALNANDETRNERLQKQYDLSASQIELINKKESNKIKSQYSSFVSQNIQKCYDLADIHVSNPQIGEDDLTFITWQIAKFVALIMHPGIIMPSSEERCMQIAHTAKLNSGCLSRQVGASITDEFFSLKGIGWNTPPEGQAPCSLRNVYDLLSHKDDLAFSKFENNNKDFRDLAKELYNNENTKKCRADLKGRNVSYCFKDLKNEIDEEKNQVHTRALHAEENAFLQIVKYGGQGIKGGKLFTTSSPCELCAKKAYQLGIREVYYLDPYPGISENHIFESGVNRPKLNMFSGAIGRAYHQLYEPIMPPKDELKMILEITTKDHCKELEIENKALRGKILELEEKLKM